MRPLSACMICRERRKKCIRKRWGMSCNFCISRGLSCPPPFQDTQSEVKKRYKPLAIQKDEKRGPISPVLHPDPEFVQEIVDLFFRYYHVSFPNIFHPPSLKRDCIERRVPRILFFGIASLSSRYASHPSLAHLPPRQRGNLYAEEAERLLDLHDASLTSIQACILLGIYAATKAEPDTESVFYSIAYRMALMLDLPNLAADSALEKEINIRVWWSLLTLDTWNSAALCIPRTIKWRDDVTLPMDEHTYLHDSDSINTLPTTPSGMTHSPHSGRPFSILGHKIKLNLLLYEIIKLNMSVVAESSPPQEIDKMTQTLIASLEEWFESISEEWKYTDENLVYWAELDMGRLFMSVYIDFNHACQLLLFRFLYLSQDPTLCHNEGVDYELACKLAQKCSFHAASICDLVRESQKHSNTQMLHSLLGHVLCIASAVQIHNLLFSDDEEKIAAARTRLEENFTFLGRLHVYWANVAASFSRLEAFHDACLQSKDSSFRLDRWMLQFIVEFASPVQGKKESSNVDQGNELWSLDRLKHLLEP